MSFFSLVFITIIYVLFNQASSKIIFDTVNKDINWLYLTKFYFHPIYGHIDISLYSFDNTIKFFVLNKQQWRDIKNDLSQICLKKELILNQTKNGTNLWSLSNSFTSIGQMHFISSRCNSSFNINDTSFTYKLILTNGDSLFTKHFSDDERGILPLFIVSTCTYTLILAIFLRYIYLSKNKSSLIIKLYLISIIFSWLHSLIYFIETLSYAFIGNNNTFIVQLLIFLARLFYIGPHVLFLLILILCTKGYLIMRVQLKKKTMVEIIVIITLYILVQILILLIITIVTNRAFVDDNILMFCNCIHMILYLLTCLWFVISLLLARKNSTKTPYIFFIFTIWFIANGIIALWNILDTFPILQTTILTTLTISNQSLTYCIFLFIIRRKTYLLRTKLNQINITYIDPTLPISHIEEQLAQEKIITTAPSELTNLCYVASSNRSRLRMPIRSFEKVPRLEPRRDIISNSSQQSCIISIQPSACPVPRRLPPMKRDN